MIQLTFFPKVEGEEKKPKTHYHLQLPTLPSQSTFGVYPYKWISLSILKPVIMIQPCFVLMTFMLKCFNL